MRSTQNNSHSRRAPNTGGAGVLVAATWAHPPAASSVPSGTKLRLGSGRLFVRTELGGSPIWLPDAWGCKPDGTLYTQAWGTLGTGPTAKTLMLRGGSTPPAVADSWVMAPDLCIDTSGDQVTVNGYGRLQGTPPNTSDGYLLYAIPTRLVSSQVDYCHIYCNLSVLGTEYRLRVKLDSTGRIRIGEDTPNWQTGIATYEANVPIFGFLGAQSAGQNRIVFNPNEPEGSEAVWNTSLGFETASAGQGHVFGLACTATGSFTPVDPEDAMTWEIVGLITRS